MPRTHLQQTGSLEPESLLPKVLVKHGHAQSVCFYSSGEGELWEGPCGQQSKHTAFLSAFLQSLICTVAMAV